MKIIAALEVTSYETPDKLFIYVKSLLNAFQQDGKELPDLNYHQR